MDPAPPIVASLARILLAVGLVIALAGGALLLADRLPFLGRLGRLPGDLHFRRGGVTIYVPLATCLLLSIVLTIVLGLLTRK